MSYGLVGALGEKVKHIVIASMILPLKTKCQMWELIINVSFICMVDNKKKLGMWPQSLLDFKAFIK
jgi:hypothetical protein